MLSKTYPKGHALAGKNTFFKEQVINELKGYDGHTVEQWNNEPLFINGRKLHTIRGNYDMWERRFKEIDAWKACLSIREWSGKPYDSKQFEIARLTKDDGIGLQKLDFFLCDISFPQVDGGHAKPHISDIAKNDGFKDSRYWVDWFRKADLTEPMAIIHFTKFRY